jgi:inhibitor of KinA
MMDMETIQPLGDQAALLYFPDEDQALQFAESVRQAALPWLVDVVSAYLSVAVFFDPEQCRFAEITQLLRALEASTRLAASRGRKEGKLNSSRKLHRIPCCYEHQLDMPRVERHTGLGAEEIVRLHTSVSYTAYAIGFCPGFPYLGYLPEALRGVPRLDAPRLQVEQGSVGLTGKQSGIYTEARPGGWNIIGRTPLRLVDVRKSYFPLAAGDRIVFERIDAKEYARLLGRPL